MWQCCTAGLERAIPVHVGGHLFEPCVICDNGNDDGNDDDDDDGGGGDDDGDYSVREMNDRPS